MPLVSIAMSVRNCEKTVGVALRSIQSQTMKEWELLIADDGSDDATVSEIKRLQDSRVKLINDGLRKGLPARLNEIMSRASGRYFARMDGDDISYPKRLEWQLDYLRSHPKVDLVGGGLLVFGNRGKILGKRIPPETHGEICRKPYAGFPMAHPTYFGRTEWFQRFGYAESILLSQDQDLLLRAFRRSCYANLPVIVLGYYEQLNLRKILRSRRFLARIIWTEYLRMGQPIVGCWGVSGQYFKAGADIIAMLTGLQYRLLRHRAKRVTSKDASQWHQVWQIANDMSAPAEGCRDASG
jgi:glycosyltransferase involved in cell wall biosynthesis